MHCNGFEIKSLHIELVRLTHTHTPKDKKKKKKSIIRTPQKSTASISLWICIRSLLRLENCDSEMKLMSVAMDLILRAQNLPETQTAELW